MNNSCHDRLKRQFEFLNEIERLKTVFRRNRTIDRSRFENSAEHSWHVALMALVLCEHAKHSHIDISHIIKMLLIHDLVEIYAGDTWVYDATAEKDQAAREHASANRLFSLLPNDQAEDFRSIWIEFEARISPEAIFAAAIDALQPLSNHLLTGEVDAPESRPSKSAVLARKQLIQKASPELWQIAVNLVEESARKGLYKNE